MAKKSHPEESGRFAYDGLFVHLYGQATVMVADLYGVGVMDREAVKAAAEIDEDRQAPDGEGFVTDARLEVDDLLARRQQMIGKQRQQAARPRP